MPILGVQRGVQDITPFRYPILGPPDVQNRWSRGSLDPRLKVTILGTQKWSNKWPKRCPILGPLLDPILDPHLVS